MIHKSFLTNSSAWNYIQSHLNKLDENSSGNKTIIWNNGLDEESITKLVESGSLKNIFEQSADTSVTRQFVILMGGPSTGKGHLVNTKFGEDFGLINGKAMKDWLDIETVYLKDIHEGDAILREIQKGIAIISFNRLYNASIAAGKKGFESAIKEIFYTTKDVTINKLSDHLTYQDFMSFLAHSEDLGSQASTLAHDIRIEKHNLKTIEHEKNTEEEKKVLDKEKISTLKTSIKAQKDKIKNLRQELKKAVPDLYMESIKNDGVFNFDTFVNEKRELPIKKLKSIMQQTRSADPKSHDAFDEFYDFTKSGFWKSMRGWKKDGANGVERFKEAARKEFEKVIKEKPEATFILGGNIIVVDSPGEDVIKQPYVGECEEAERSGFVTNIINLDPRISNSMITLMRLSNLTRSVNSGDRMVDDKDITGYADNIDDALSNIHSNKYPDGPVHRYFHLVRNVTDKEDIIKIVGALYGAKSNKDQFIYPKNFMNGKELKPDISFSEIHKAIDKANINIALSNSIKKLPMLSSWWRKNVNQVIYGENPVVLYEIKKGEVSSFNTNMTSKEILIGVSNRLGKTDSELSDIKHDDYNKMIKSVERWSKEYDEWTDKDTWTVLKPTLNIKESNKVDGFEEYIKKLND